MNQASSNMSQNFTIVDLAYDVQLQALRHGKRMEFLTLCESKIVAYLFRNPGRHISPEILIGAVTAIGVAGNNRELMPPLGYFIGGGRLI